MKEYYCMIFFCFTKSIFQEWEGPNENSLCNFFCINLYERLLAMHLRDTFYEHCYSLIFFKVTKFEVVGDISK